MVNNMATTKPRITISLSQRQYELLKIITENSGSSMSSTVTSLLSGAEPTLEHMATAFQKLRKISDEQKLRFSQSLERASSEIEPLAVSSLKQFDNFLDTLSDISDGKLDDSRPVLTGGAPCL